MNSRLKPYEEYRDTEDLIGLESVPKHWKIIQNSLLFREVVDTNNEDLELLSILMDKGIVKQSSTGRKNRMSQDNSMYKKICVGDIGYNLMNAFMGALGVSKYEGIISPAYAVCRPKIQLNSWYYHYLFRTPLYKTLFDINSYGIMYERNRLYFDRFKQIKALLPPMEEQDQIVRYLDNKLSKINKFIKDKKKLIELLKEQKQVVIKQAVIKGLDPNVKMKPSGIEWLGDIPEGWKVKPMKYFAKIRNGKDFVFDKKGNIPVYGSGGKFSTTNKVMFSKPSVLLGRKGTIDKPILVKEPFWSVDTAFYTEIKENINLKYFYYLCCNIDFGYYVNGTALPSMTQTILNGIKLTCPPVSEQKRIIAYIESKTQIIDKAIDRINNEIDLMTEYRTSLTSNVITGKVDVRHIEVEDSIEEIEMFEALKKENIEE